MEKFKYNEPDEIIIKLKKIIKNIEQIQAEVQGAGVTHTQARIIMPIVKHGHGHTLQELTEFARVDKALVSRTIADLESKGLVERDKNSDGTQKNYKYKIVLTTKGQELFAIKFEKHRAKFEKMQSEITQQEMKTFIKVINKLSEIE